MEIKWKPVINYSQGRFGFRPEAIVIHIAEGWLAGGYSWFNNASSQVSSHFMIGKNGEIWQFVSEDDTAWHAGGVANASWQKLKPGINPNLYTIGIENEGFTGEQFTEEMYASNAFLIAKMALKYSIPINRTTVIGHYEINSSSRPNCPGTGIDFNKLIELSKLLLEDPEMIENLQKQIAELKKEIAKLQSDNKNSEKKIKELVELNNEQEIVSKQKEEELILIENQNSKLRQEIKKLQDQLNKFSKTNDTSNNTNNGGILGMLKRLFNGKNSSN